MGRGEYWRAPEPERKPERQRSPESDLEREPRLHRRLKAKNKLVSQLYQYASGETHTSPVSSVTTPEEAMDNYVKLTIGEAAAAATAPPTPSAPLPPTQEILIFDPFATDPNNLSGSDRRKISAMFASLRKRDSNTREVSILVAEELPKFVAAFSKLENVPAMDKADVTGSLKTPGVRDFRDSLRLLVSKYIVLKSKEKSVTPEDLKTVLESGFHAYAQTFSTDIPYYNKVYEYFDSKRKGKRRPQEVYLGRDGMYASLGRRSQDLAKSRQAGPKKRLAARKSGEPIEINPKYLVYPRFYRDKLSQQTKELYLESQGLKPDSDPIFFDTGFTGSVPEQILDILGIAKEGRDERIKMLSARTEARRVPGIPSSDRDKIVNAIEYNMKPEEPSAGIMVDSMGRLNHVAKPTSPEEQFIFEMIRLAIVRHYWLTERSVK